MHFPPQIRVACCGVMMIAVAVLASLASQPKAATRGLANSKAAGLAAQLRADGTLKASARGSFDARGYRLKLGAKGEPHFVTAATASDDDKWDGQFSLSGFNESVEALAVNGSDIYVGGYFTAIGSLSASYIAKWNGTTWSALGSGTNGQVYALAVSGTDLYVGGAFTTAGGLSANHIARWNGSAWFTLGSGSNDYVDALAVSGANVYAGGAFTTAGGVSANRIAKWNGSAWSALGSGMDGEVSALAVSGTDLYAGGWFTTAGGVNVNYIAKWNGSAWSALGGGMNGTSLYAGGSFWMAGGVEANSIAKWDGNTWSALGFGTDGGVYSLVSSGNDLYVGGGFIIGDASANNIAKWNGSAWFALGSGTDDTVSALAVSGTSLYVGGQFTTAGAKPSVSFGRYQLDALVAYPNASVVAGGNTTVSPTGAPSGFTSATASATGYSGLLAVDPTTGIVRVTNAQPAGAYTVTVKYFSGSSSALTTTFTLTVTNQVACANPSFTSPADVTVGTSPYSLVASDFNGDGKLDFASVNQNSNTASIRLGDGAGNFSNKPDVNVGNNPRALVTGDFNGDGKLDFATANVGNSNVSIRLGDGTGAFTGTTNIAVAAEPRSITAADFNSDGKLDFATGNFSANTLSIRLGDGAGGFTNAAEVSTDSGPQGVTAGDFNGDGKLDLAAAHYNSGTVTIRLGDGTGGFTGTTSFAVATNAFGITTADFNGDGKLDLAVANAGSNSVSIRLGDGAGNFTGTTTVGVSGWAIAIAPGDFNGDGKLDLAVACTTSNRLSIRLGDGAGQFSGTTEVVVNSGPQGLTLGDFNNDGKLDLIAANINSNNITLRLRAACNQSPTIVAGSTVTRLEGQSGSATIATVSDSETPAGSLIVTVAIPAPLINVSNIVNTNGTITANVAASCGATFSANTVVLRVTDGGGATATANLTVNVTPNSAPILAYSSSYTTNTGTPLTINPTLGPSDNLGISSVTVSNVSPTPAIGTITVTNAGVVSVPNNLAAGIYTVTIRAADSCNASVTASFKLTVCGVPAITTQPIAQTVSANANVSFNVAATGSGLSYQWRKGGVALSNSATVSGVTAATLVLSGVTATANAGSYDVLITGTCGTVISAAATLTVSTAASTLFVNEFRFSGPNGLDDWYVELYNNSDTAISTNGLKLTWINAAGTQTGSVAFATGRTIQARGYYLIAGSAYSLASVAAADETAAALSSAGILGGVQVCDATGKTFDAAGTTVLQASGMWQFAEGTPVTALGLVTAEHAWVRKQPTNSSFPQDTNHNQNDFALVATTATALNGITPKLGAPGPQNRNSPAFRNALFLQSLLDASVGTSSFPNFLRDLTPLSGLQGAYPLGSFYLRRTFTNNTGAAITRLRAYIFDITDGTISGQANIRALDAADVLVNGKAVKGISVNNPPAQASGGGLNSSLTIRLSEAIPAGGQVHVQFRLGVLSGGSYRFFVNLEPTN